MKEKVKLNTFGEIDKELSIDNDNIQFNGKEIKREDITEIKYWISQMVFYKFPIGRRYYIGFRTHQDQLDIIFKSYFGVDNKYFYRKCRQIIDEVWESTIERILDRETEKLIKGDPVWFGHCQINKRGIIISKDNFSKKTEQIINWADLAYEKKYDKLVLNSNSDYIIWTNLYFSNSWNIEILLALLDWITKEDGLSEIKYQLQPKKH